jgi:hypothetical protein
MTAAGVVGLVNRAALPKTNSEAGNSPVAAPSTSSAAGSPALAAASPEATITVPAPGWCNRTQVDLDDGSVVADVEPTDDVLQGRVDVTYDGCSQGLTYRTGGTSLGFGSSGQPTRDQCAADARRNPLPRPQPIASIQVGTVLCATTSDLAVAWIKVIYVGEPNGRDDAKTPAKPSLKIAVRMWR